MIEEGLLGTCSDCFFELFVLVVTFALFSFLVVAGAGCFFFALVLLVLFDCSILSFFEADTLAAGAGENARFTTGGDGMRGTGSGCS